MSVRYPNLAGERIIAVDIETNGLDPMSQSAAILGVSLATMAGFAEYYNLGSDAGQDDGECGYNIEKNRAYLRDVLNTPYIAKLGAYLPFDVSWLSQDKFGIGISGQYIDVQANEFLIDEHRDSYSLESLLHTYGLPGKDVSVPVRRLEQLGVFTNTELRAPHSYFRKYLYLLRYKDIRDYALRDVANLFPLYAQQYRILCDNGLVSAYDVECEMIAICNEMYCNGSLINLGATERLCREYTANRNRLNNELSEMCGGHVRVNSNKDLSRVFSEQGVSFGPSPNKGEGRFSSEILEGVDHPLAKKVLALRVQTKNLNSFPVKFLELEVGGRLHSRFHSTIGKGMDIKTGGTITGRLSSSDPNMQNIPVRDNKYVTGEDIRVGTDVRSLFEPEPGMDWGCLDLSQVEFRTLAHYGVGAGVSEVRAAYNMSPSTDYHAFVEKLTGLGRTEAKCCNFLMVYRGGAGSLARLMKTDVVSARRVMDEYFSKLGFVKETPVAVEESAARFGYVRTLAGRKLHFRNKKACYMAFSRLNQGSAADILKAGLVRAWRGGVFRELVLHSTVHDENNVSVPRTAAGREAFKHLKYCMENALHLRVPLLANIGIGKNWLDAKGD